MPYGRNSAINRSPEANTRARVTEEIFYVAARTRDFEFYQDYLGYYPKRFIIRNCCSVNLICVVWEHLGATRRL